MRRILTLFLFLIVFVQMGIAQEHSVAMQWNETQLNCIRNYAPKPTVHARSLFHGAILMWDMWAVYDDAASTYFLGKTVGGYSCPFNGISMPANGDIEAAREKAISYAMYRYLWNRYTIFTPNAAKLAIIQGLINAQMTALGYDPAITSTNYSDGDPAKLGNYIAAKMEEFSLGDGSNQANNYGNVYYQTAQGDIWAQLPGNPECTDLNRWQEMALDVQYDQNGNLLESAPIALSPEWGNVVPFSLTDAQSTSHERDGHDWKVYLDPGEPPLHDMDTQTGMEDPFKWGYVLNIIWSSFHNNPDGVMIDIGPGSLGNNNFTDVSDFPDTFEEIQDFYDLWNGGDSGPGYAVNPVTGLPYEPNLVPRKDYSRVLSHFWSDGPNSETPPGHWFTILNDVAEHELFEKRWEGEGPIMDDLEWDVKAYFALGGAIHDAAVACWSTKGYYDYTRPMMAIRALAALGQSSDPMLPNYHPGGIPLVPGYIELVGPGDPLVGANNEHLNKIKYYTWRGPVAGTGQDGVGWILAERWWTYQVATFVTPPFPGYFSGHSTFSRSGAEVLTLLTGDPYFPGGLGEYTANANSYLTADVGPSVNVTMQWATYRDASDQCSLARIFSGLHPPQDDIPGRKVGIVVGPQAYHHAEEYFDATVPHATVATSVNLVTDANVPMVYFDVTVNFSEPMDTAWHPVRTLLNGTPTGVTFVIDDEEWLDNQTYVYHYVTQDANTEFNNIVVKVSLGKGQDGQFMVPALSLPITFDTKNPTVASSAPSAAIVNDAVATAGTFTATFNFSEAMNTGVTPTIAFTADDPSATLTSTGGSWADNDTYNATFSVADATIEQADIDVQVTVAKDAKGNDMVSYAGGNLFTIDTKNPTGTANISGAYLYDADVMEGAVVVNVAFDEAMNTSAIPSVSFPAEDGWAAGLSQSASSSWIDAQNFELVLDLADNNVKIEAIDVQLTGACDLAGNMQVEWNQADAISVDTQNPSVSSVVTTTNWVADADAGNDGFSITFTFDEDMDGNFTPVVTFPDEDPEENTLTLASTSWTNPLIFVATYDVADAGEEIENIDVEITGAIDMYGNEQQPSSSSDVFNIDTRNPVLISLFADDYSIDDSNDSFSLIAVFDEDMDEDGTPNVEFGTDVSSTLSEDGGDWLNSTTYEAIYEVADADMFIADIDVTFGGLTDLAGNPQEDGDYEDFFDIETGVGISEENELYNVSVYPNPVSVGTDITVYIGKVAEQLKVQLFNSNGQLVAEVQNPTNNHFVRMSTNNLAAGMYVVNLTGSEGQQSFSVSVVK